VAMADAPRVLVAADDAELRAVLRRVVEWDGFEVCAEAGDADGAVMLARLERPDIAVLDVRLPGHGIQAATQIGRAMPNVAIVVISPDDADLFPALRAGASGYVLEGSVPDALTPALRSVLDDGAALPPSLVARLVDEFRPRHQHRLARHGSSAVRLTEREWEVLELLAAGLNSGDIAIKLDVLPVTVRTHVSAIVRKLDATDRESAVRMFLER
jgi:DNA-binding NarL/FixJ family response regulator